METIKNLYPLHTKTSNIREWLESSCKDQLKLIPENIPSYGSSPKDEIEFIVFINQRIEYIKALDKNLMRTIGREF